MDGAAGLELKQALLRNGAITPFLSCSLLPVTEVQVVLSLVLVGGAAIKGGSFAVLDYILDAFA